MKQNINIIVCIPYLFLLLHWCNEFSFLFLFFFFWATCVIATTSIRTYHTTTYKGRRNGYRRDRDRRWSWRDVHRWWTAKLSSTTSIWTINSSTINKNSIRMLQRRYTRYDIITFEFMSLLATCIELYINRKCNKSIAVLCFIPPLPSRRM